MRLLFVFGTRPEAIKLAPLIRKFKTEEDFSISICITSQHREMLRQMLDFFEIKPDYDLKIMVESQNLHDVTCKVLQKIQCVFLQVKPHMVFVQGDTTSAFATALASFYQKIPIAHVEAGLRTFDKYAPFPEEINRVLISHLAEYHFCPTTKAKENLLKEGVNEHRIYVVGNTVIDALIETLEIIQKRGLEQIYQKKFEFVDFSKQVLLVTTHRRESFGRPLQEICHAIKQLAFNFERDIEIILPVHLNPKVRTVVETILTKVSNVHLLPPLSYPKLIWLMSKCHFILTDSGGIQEEASFLGKPVLIMRGVTERPEIVKEGKGKIVGANKEKIFKEATGLITDKAAYKKMARACHIYGDGHASERIIKTIKAAGGNLDGTKSL